MKKIGKLVADRDFFGQTLALNFRGESQLKTVRGGLVSIFVAVLTFWQSLALLQQIYQQTDPVISTYEVHERPEEGVSLKEMKQMFSAKIYDFNSGDETLDPRAGSFVAG